MVGILEFFSAPGFQKPFRANSYQAHWIAGIVYKLHSMTGSFLFFSSCVIFIKELMGDHIHCIQDGAGNDDGKITQEAFDSYCYISSTFTLPPTQILGSKRPELGFDVAHPGVRPRSYKEEAIYHNYYQWVPYLLFIQSLTFFAPLMIHRFIQDGRVQRVIQDLHNIIAYSETRDDMYGEIWVFFRDWYCHQTWWALKLVMVDSLNLINILCNIFFVDWYLGYQFLTYGSQTLEYRLMSMSERGPDPFDVIFPKMTKCSLNKFGPSGTVQTFDALCIMTVNVLNEKVYLLVWFVFLFLSVFTLIHHTIALIIICFPKLRKSFLSLYISPERRDQKKKLSKILDLTEFGDWMMLYMLAKNTDRVIFGEIIENLKYPDYHHSLEELDEENRQILQRRNYQKEIKPELVNSQNYEKHY